MEVKTNIGLITGVRKVILSSLANVFLMDIKFGILYSLGKCQWPYISLVVAIGSEEV